MQRRCEAGVEGGGGGGIVTMCCCGAVEGSEYRMYLFQYVCHVDPEGELAQDSRFDDIGGAYVDVWIAFADVEGAEELSRFYARRGGWRIDKATGT